MTFGLLTLFICLLCTGAFYAIQSRGKYKEKAVNLQREKEENLEAKAIKDRVVVDVNFRERVRREYD